MRARLKRLADDPFYKHNLVFFGGSMMAAVLNYLYHPVLSRLMSVESFGETQALFSLYMQGGVILSVIGMVLLHIFSNRTDEHESSELLATLYSLSFFLMLTLAVGLALFSPLLAHFMQFHSVLPFFALSLIFLISAPFNFYKFFLQAKQNFPAVSTSAIILALGRLLASALLVFFISSTVSAMAGLAVAVFLALLYVRKKASPLIRLPRLQKIHFSHSLRREGAYAALIFCGTMFVTLLYTADTVIVKSLFDPSTAGIYSGVATVARTIFFATGSISGVLIAHTKLSHAPLQNHQTFMKALMLTLLVGGGFLILFALFPGVILNTLIGTRYDEFTHLLPPLSLAICMVSLIQLFVSHFLALRTYLLIPIALGGGILLSLLVIFFHQSPQYIVHDFLVAALATLLAFGTLYIVQMKKWKRST